jgi:hypothetical protein
VIVQNLILDFLRHSALPNTSKCWNRFRLHLQSGASREASQNARAALGRVSSVQTSRAARLFQIPEFFNSLRHSHKLGIKSMSRRFPL